tara:strand:+ start:298 stop:609 length:312 start_codon:yes stop_codon:yes gene_type:complete
MDYREIFRNALQSYEKIPNNSYLNNGDIIDMASNKYLVLQPYGKFHRLLHLVSMKEYLVNLSNKNFIRMMPNTLKRDIKNYKKKKFNLNRYIRKEYIYKYSLS